MSLYVKVSQNGASTLEVTAFRAWMLFIALYSPGTYKAK